MAREFTTVSQIQSADMPGEFACRANFDDTTEKSVAPYCLVKLMWRVGYENQVDVIVREKATFLQSQG